MLVLIELEIKGYNIQVIKQSLAKEYEKNIQFFKEWKNPLNLNLLSIFIIELYKYRINSTLSVNEFFEFLDDDNHVKITLVATGGKKGMILRWDLGAEESGEEEILNKIISYAESNKLVIFPDIQRKDFVFEANES